MVVLGRIAAVLGLLGLAGACNLVTGVSDYEKGNGGAGGAGAAGGGGVGGAGGAVDLGVIAALNSGRFGSCAITEERQLWCWGLYPGVAGLAVSTKPVRVELDGSVETVALGHYHRCAVVTSTSGTDVLCWGDNSHGQLGNDDGAISLTPVAVSDLAGRLIDTISAGHSHTCAFGDEVPLYCWGDNGYGQLAVGGSGFLPTPTEVPVPNPDPGTGGAGGGSGVIADPSWERASAGLYFTCGIARDGDGATTTYCWGRNDRGQLGQDPATLDATPDPQEIPPPPGAAIERIYPGGAHLCVRDTDKRLYCLGANDFGQIGNGTVTAFQETLTNVLLPADLDTLAAGARHSCARHAVGSEFATLCWGANDLGQLNVGGGDIEPSPKEIVFEKTSLFSYGKSEHVCVAKGSDGSLWCWGANDMGQLGIGTITPFEAAPQVVSPR